MQMFDYYQLRLLELIFQKEGNNHNYNQTQQKSNTHFSKTYL